MNKQDSIIDEKQICFPVGEFMLCNYIVKKDGAIIRGVGKYLKFPLKKRFRKKKEPDINSDSISKVKSKNPINN